MVVEDSTRSLRGKARVVCVLDPDGGFDYLEVLVTGHDSDEINGIYTTFCSSNDSKSLQKKRASVYSPEKPDCINRNKIMQITRVR